jgi:membrane protease YdiL (CAAX protease family)
MYLVGVASVFATGTQKNPQLGILVVMFSPMVGALIARFVGRGLIRWGRPDWWILIALMPVLTVFVAYAIGAALGVASAHYGELGRALLLSPIVIVYGSVFALGEEVGWRGFLWPLMRRRWRFLFSALVLAIVWLSFHVPLILLGWYGSRAGLPAATVGLAGLTLFIGVITDRSRAVWPSVVAHGGWNLLVVTGFAAGGRATRAVFTGNPYWVGEFGWLAATAMLLTGVLATWWHLSRRMSSGER